MMFKENEMEAILADANAVAQTENVLIYVTWMFECGYAIISNINGKEDYDDCFTAVKAMETFAKMARENNVEKCLVRPEWLDRKYLEELDKEHDQYRRQEAYAEACMASAYGDDRLLDRWNRENGIENEYGPSNPWDAPGMSVRDFI